MMESDRPYDAVVAARSAHVTMAASEDVGGGGPYGEVSERDDLYIADGSVMPGPVGAKPARTIAEPCERFSARAIDGKGACQSG